MSILTGVIAFPPDEPKDYNYGPTIKFKIKPATGGDLITLFCKADHADAPALAKGVTVFYQMDGGKAKFMGVDQAQLAPAPASPATPAAPPQPKPTAGQLAAMYVKIWAELEPLQLDAEGHRQATATVFIAATGAGIYE